MDQKYFAALCIMTMVVTVSLAQSVIPYGSSRDSVPASDGRIWELWYYKPPNYDLINEPKMLWYLHGSGGSGGDIESRFKEIADRQNTMLVGPTFSSVAPAYAYVPSAINQDEIIWLPRVFKDFYRHILKRESADSIPTYLTGFSSGGQGVTRYMLVRQMIPDSIPIVMAVSVNPLFYTMPTDSVNGVAVPYPCGLHSSNHGFPSWGVIEEDWDMPYKCGAHIEMYYRENYGVMIGELDSVGNGTAGVCNAAEGGSRLERARFFYALAQSDAIARKTPFRWKYAEVTGVGHSSFGMYQTKASPADTLSIAERMLFESDYQKPITQAPTAEFEAIVSEEYCNLVSFRPNCLVNHYTTVFKWAFGDGDTSTQARPVHIYSNPGNYVVTFVIENQAGLNWSDRIVTISKIPPEADFTLDTNVVFLPDATIAFRNNTNGNIYSYWDFGDSTGISNDKHPVHTYTWADTFRVTLTVVDATTGCADTISRYVIVRTLDGISESVVVAAVSIYPNPATDFANIRFVLPERSRVQFDLYDITGRFIRPVYAGFADASAVNIIDLQTHDLPSGLYLGLLSTAGGSKMLKIIVVD